MTDSAQLVTTTEAVLRAGGVMTGPLSPAVYVITATSGTITWNVAAGQAQGANVYSLTLTGNATINIPTGGTDGQLIRLRLVSNSHTVTWGSGWDWGSAGAPTLTTGRDRIVAEYVASATAWDAAADLGH